MLVPLCDEMLRSLLLGGNISGQSHRGVVSPLMSKGEAHAGERTTAGMGSLRRCTPRDQRGTEPL